MTSTAEERVQAAYDAAVTGDVSDLVSLLHPDVEWRGNLSWTPVVAPHTQLTRA